MQFIINDNDYRSLNELGIYLGSATHAIAQTLTAISPLYQKECIMSMVISRYLNYRENRLPTLQSQHLFALTKEVRIEHEGEEYRLRLTRNNRLILTK